MTEDKKPRAPTNRKERAVRYSYDSVPGDKPSLSERFADAVTSGMGSWKFVGGQVVVLAAWITLNTTNVLPIPHWDPNLILLNLALSCEAAFAGAFILMSQNRQAAKDRKTVLNDYHVDLSSARNITELNRKLDMLLATIPPEKLRAMMQEKATDDSAPQADASNDNAAALKKAAKPTA